MLKRLFILILIIGIVLTIGFFFFKNTNNYVVNPTTSPTAQQSPIPSPIHITASFTIITGNITRNFTAEKYHNQSPDVYIKNPDPTIVHVTKLGVTWDDFFKTLPMKLTKDCLITGDGESLCKDKGTLQFFLNDIETPDVLDQEIKSSDKVLVKFNY